jgi:arylsulfatase A-like enzyme
MLLLALLVSCTTPAPTSTVPTPDPTPRTPPVARTLTAVPLARRAPDAITLPPRSRGLVEERFTPHGAAQRGETKGGATVWRLPLPAHSNLFPARQAGARSFGNWAPAGLTVTLGQRQLRFKRFAAGAWTYGYDRRHLLLGLPVDHPGPTAEDVGLTWPKARKAEDSLHFATAGLSDVDFVNRTITIGEESHTGTLLPAPASASWSLTVPTDAVLTARARILDPAIAAPTESDGATLVVRIAVGETKEVAARLPVAGRWSTVRVDLSRWAGEAATLTLATETGDDPTLDLVFLEEPTVYTPTDDPKRVVVAFLDTVRADHLGMYGYARPTTPKLDQWSATALRMDANRTVAPWTLPSARAVMTGAQPEQYFDTATLPARLADAGFVTDGVVGNAYLSQVFEMHRGFGHYRYDHLLPASRVVDHALEVFERWPDRDVFVWVQFMDAHLPYYEPKAYRELFAGPKPASLASVSRVELVKWDGDEPDFEAVRDHVVGRYDQNLRVLDDQLDRLLDAAGPDATVALFADHGEEFWDHGAFEHGHTFHDELLRVPMLIADPHLQPGALSVPTSLLDLTPTVLQLAGLPHEAADGLSLVDAAFGSSDALGALQARPQAFGRPLYDADGWGVLYDSTKWWDRDGISVAYDLTADPGEQDALSPDDQAAVGQLAEALGRPVRRAWRLDLDPRATRGWSLLATHPDGITAATGAYDPRGNHEGVTIRVDGEGRAVLQAPKNRGLPILYLTTNGATAEGLTVVATGPNGKTRELTCTSKAQRGVLAESDGLRLDAVFVPDPAGTAVSAFHPDVEAQLQELGYLDHE